jgi:hypothetical protein
VEESDRGDSSVEGSDEGDISVEGSEEYFDESEHVDGFAAEERSTDCEEVDESEGEDDRSPEGSDFAAEEGYEEDGSGPEGSDFPAEEGYEEGGPVLERSPSHVPQANPRKGLLQRCVYHEPRTSHGHT